MIEWDADEVLSAFTFNLTDDAGGRFAIDSVTGEITVADGSLIDYETAASHDVIVEVTDAAGNASSESVTISIDNLGDQPAQTIPLSIQNVDEDGSLTFSSLNGNAISVSDTADSQDAPMQVSLSVNQGTLMLSQTTGLSILGGANGSASMVIQGIESDLNAALEGLVYVPDANQTGSDTLTVTTSFDSDLLGHYQFAGSADDVSVGTVRDGTLIGDATTTTDPQRGEVLRLDGTGDYVEVAGLYGNPTSVTLAAWIKTSDLGKDQEIISLGDSVALRLDSSGLLNAFFYDGSSWIGLDTVAVDSQWHHVAMTFDDASDRLTLYLDGEAVGTATVAGSIRYTLGSNTRIGSHANGETTRDFSGDIDDVRIYGRVLSSDQVAALATDQAETSGNVAIQVAPINDAPVLTPSGLSYGTAEGASAFSATVATLLGSNLTDADAGAVEGLAVTGISGTGGTLEYSMDGITWTAVPSVSPSASLLLRATDRFRFSPATDNGGTLFIDDRGWDQTTASAGSLADT